MTTVLHLPARTDVPVACDMSTARDTFEERFAEYGELFERSLLNRERRADSVVFWFRADAREQIEDLVQREHACCPFFELRVEAIGDEVVWTTTNGVAGEDRAAVDVHLDEFYALPDHTGSGLDAYLSRLADQGVKVERVGDERLELR